MQTANVTRMPKRRLSLKTQELEKRLKYLPFIRRASEVDSDEATSIKAESKLEATDNAIHVRTVCCTPHSASFWRLFKGDRDPSLASSSIPFGLDIVYESAPLPDLAMQHLHFWDTGCSHRTQRRGKRIPQQQDEAIRHPAVETCAVDSGKIQSSQRRDEAAPGDHVALEDSGSDIVDATAPRIHSSQSIHSVVNFTK